MNIINQILLLALWTCNSAPGLAQSLNQDFMHLEVLEGTWQINGSTEFEHWDSNRENMLVGMGYTLKSADTIVNEKLELGISGGHIYYTATVMRQNKGLPVKFDYKGRESNSYSFENKQHDFPQVITYTFQNKDTILITLKGKGKVQERTVQFIMSRLNH